MKIERKLKLFVVIVMTLVLSGIPIVSGCHRGPTHITNLPVGVNENEVLNWYAATADLKDISNFVKGGTDAVIQLHNVKALPGGDEYYQQVLGIFAKIGQAEDHAANILATTPKTFGTSVTSKLQTDIQTITSEFAKLTTDKTLNADPTVATILQGLQLSIVVLQDVSAFRK